MTDSTPPQMLAGWYSDPAGIGDARYWNGSMWTNSISSDGVTLNVPIDADKTQVPPVPGTEFTAPPARQSMPPQTPAPPPTVSPPLSTAAPEHRKSSGGMATAIVVLAIAIIAAVALAVTFGGNDSDDEPGPTDGPAPTDAPAETPAPAEAPAESEQPADEGG